MHKPVSKQRGYLNEDFRFFHIRDKLDIRFDYHYHAFDKIIVFLSGRVTYIIEDKAYHLAPWDVLVIPRDQVHRPVIEADETYERMILYMDSAFLTHNSEPGHELDNLFKLARERRFNLLRLDPTQRLTLMGLLNKLADSVNSTGFGHSLLSRSLCLQCLIELNRIALGDESSSIPEAYTADPKISEIVAYINDNLSGDLLLDAIAKRFFVSRSFLMHKFRDVTGYPPHAYIKLKRLLLASELIASGATAAEACESVGYGDYSAFSRAFKKLFDASPSTFTARRE